VFQYKALVVNIVDADTVDLMVDVGFRHWMKDRFRLYGIDAWEPKGKEREKGVAATLALKRFIDKKELTIKTHSDKQGKYGRWLADLYLDNTHINKWLVESGHAVWVDY